MAIQISHRDRPIQENRGGGDVATEEMRGWMEAVTKLLNFLDVAEGSGSPEGVLIGQKKKMYLNNTGSAGTLVYIKTTTTGNTGWVAIG